MSKGAAGEQATAALARFVAETQAGDLPARVREHAKLVVADTIGVSLRGSLEPEMRSLHARLPEGSGSTLLSGGFRQASPAVAAFANATAACFLELDEGSRPTGHPAVHVLPAALAASEAERKSGSAFLTALVLGYEVQARIQWAARLRWPVHPHGNFGHVAATAALGKLSGWNAEQMRQGLNIAAALVMGTSWMPCLVGATVRNTYPGLTAQTAFTVKLLVESGFTGYEGALEESFGEILGDGFSPSALTDRLGERYCIVENYFKFHAACALNHPVLDALADALGASVQPGTYPPLTAAKRPEPALIRRVEVQIAERSMRLAVAARRNQLSAKFSIPYAAAAYLVRGDASPDSFRGEALDDPDIQALATRVEVLGQPELSARWPEEAAARVRIELADGRSLSGTCANPFGSAAVPPSPLDLQVKFSALTADLLTADQQEAFWESALRVEQVASMDQFLLPLRGGKR
jgi:2-methylcitrate dehydratase PrpD